MVKQYETDLFCLCHNKYTTSISIFATSVKKVAVRPLRPPPSTSPYGVPPTFPLGTPPPSIELKLLKLRILAHRTRLLPDTATTPSP